MAALPKVDGLIEAIDAAFVAQADLAPRAHLGASVLGRECERALWYSFRWAITENPFDGRMLRLFARGQREEEWFATLLSLAGCTVQTHNSYGKQFNFKEPGLGGHLAGSPDGIVQGIPEAPKTWHVLECKTHNNKSFKKLCAEGVQASKPDHFAQTQLYMRWASLDRALYLAVNKNDDSLYIERVAYDKAFSDRLAAKGARVIAAQEPPARLSDDPAFFKCKLCEFHSVCHMGALPSVTCRSCLHSTPVVDDSTDAKWHCAKWDSLVPHAEAMKAQPCHRYIPALIPWAHPMDVTDDGDVIYNIREDGRVFLNGENVVMGLKAYSSIELCAAEPALIGDEGVEALRLELHGEIVQQQKPDPVAAEFDDSEIPF